MGPIFYAKIHYQPTPTNILGERKPSALEVKVKVKVKVKQSRYRPGVSQKVPGS